MPSNHPNNSPQVNLAEKAGVKTGAGRHPQKKKYTGKNKAAITALVLVILAALAFLIYGAYYVYREVVPQDSTSDVDAVEHTTTPAADREKVGYYIVGLLGADNTSPTETLAVLCFDKQKKTVNILEIPQQTYVGDTDNYTVRNAGEVWGNPKPIDWCATCRRAVPASEIADGKHTVCGTKITQMTGSASQDLCRLVNTQYGLPVDGYFMIPQQALVKLVNLLGGVDVNLESSMKVNNIKFNAGTQTLDGDSALYYMTNHSSGIGGDIDRLVKDRKVYLALFQRLQRQTEDQLTNDSIGPLMNGSTPICTDLTREEMATLLQEMSAVKTSSMTAYILPGESAKKSGSYYYSAHKADLLSLLNQSFNPCGLSLDESKLGLAELASGGKADTHTQAFSDIEVTQSGAVATTTAATTG